MDYTKIANDALEARARLVAERRSVTEDKNLSDAEKRERYEALDADIDRLMGEAREAVTAGEAEAEHRSLVERAGALGTLSEDRSGDTDEPTLHDDFRALLRGEVRSVDVQAVTAVEKRATAGAKVGVAAWAGNAGHDTFVATLLESLETHSDVVNRITKVTTSSGEKMSWPRRVSRLSGTFKVVAEGGTYQKATDGSLDQFDLSATKFGALAQYSEEAATDLLLPIGAMIAEDAGIDLGDSLAAAVWNNTSGTDFDSGLLETGHGQNQALASASAITFDELIDVQHNIRAPYRRNAAFYLSDDTAKAVRKLKDGDDNYIWQPAVIAGQPDVLLGKPVETDENLPTLNASGASGTALARGVVVFGDLGRAYILRLVRGVEVVRSEEYGFDTDMHTLKIRVRVDGGVKDENAYATLDRPAVA